MSVRWVSGGGGRRRNYRRKREHEEFSGHVDRACKEMLNPKWPQWRKTLVMCKLLTWGNDNVIDRSDGAGGRSWVQPPEPSSVPPQSCDVRRGRGCTSPSGPQDWAGPCWGREPVGTHDAVDMHKPIKGETRERRGGLVSTRKMCNCTSQVFNKYLGNDFINAIISEFSLSIYLVWINLCRLVLLGFPLCTVMVTNTTRNQRVTCNF